MKSSQIAAVKMFLRYGSKLLGYILNFFAKFRDVPQKNVVYYKTLYGS